MNLTSAPSDAGGAPPDPGSMASRFEMVERPCPICGTDEGAARVVAEARFDPARLDAFAFASRKIPEHMHHRLVECPACDLVYASPAPTAESLGALYSDAAFDSGEEAHYAAATYSRFLPRVVRRLPDLDGAVDIGTGDGAFLERLLDAGFSRVVGVEPSAAPIAAARDDVRPLIREGLFRAEDFEPGRYSLVTCFQTIEHAYSPSTLAEGAFALLKEGGAAFFIGHDRRGLVNRVLGSRSPIFDIEHLQLFSPRSIRALFERAGFRDVEVFTLVNRYPLGYWTKLFPIPRKLKPATLGLLRGTGLGRIPVSLPVGNLAVIGYRPAGGGTG